jgi:hypothetical protein
LNFVKPVSLFDTADALGRSGAETRTMLVRTWASLALSEQCLRRSMEALAVSRELLNATTYVPGAGLPRAQPQD